MKATLEFNDDEELRDAIDGWKWKHAMWELDQEMRGIVKHGYIGNREATNQEIEAADWCRTKIREHLESNNLNLEQ